MIRVNMTHGFYRRWFIPINSISTCDWDLFVPVEALKPVSTKCSISSAQNGEREMLKHGKMIIVQFFIYMSVLYFIKDITVYYFGWFVQTVCITLLFLFGFLVLDLQPGLKWTLTERMTEASKKKKEKKVSSSAAAHTASLCLKSWLRLLKSVWVTFVCCAHICCRVCVSLSCAASARCEPPEIWKQAATDGPFSVCVRRPPVSAADTLPLGSVVFVCVCV